MAWTITQAFPRTDHEGWWMLKEALVAGAATVKLSSDGVTGGPFTGDQISPGGPYPDSGAADRFSTTGAWMVIAFPAVDGVTREWCFEKHSFAGRIHAWYSSDGTGFTGGAILARATAIDEQFVQDGDDNFWNNINPQEFVGTFWVGDVNEKYSFLAEAREFGRQAIESVFFMDVVTDPIAGDADPCVVAMAPVSGSSQYLSPGTTTSLFGRSIVDTTTVNIAGWYDLGGPLEAWLAWPWTTPGFAVGFAGSVDSWHHDNIESQQQNDDGNYDMYPIIYMRGEQLFGLNEKGWKGISRIFQIISTQSAGFVSATSHGMRVNADGTLTVAGGVVRPWDPSLPKVWY